MKLASLLPVVLLAAGLGAQQPSATTSTFSGSLDLEHTVSRCAIGMFARQGGGLHILRAGKEGESTQPAMEPSLTLHDTNGKQIVSASILARGYGAPKGATPLQTGNESGTHDDLGGSLVAHPANRTDLMNSPAQRPSLARTLTVKFQPDGDADFSGDFRLPGFVVLESIALNSITYADGSVRNFDASICSTKPSLLMLVSSH
jgi:hypothetical protein